jgi:hypothetical protein
VPLKTEAGNRHRRQVLRAFPCRGGWRTPGRRGEVRRVVSLTLLVLLLAAIPLLADGSLPMPCPGCGSEYTWHAFRCPKCGTEWIAPACIDYDGAPARQPCPGPEDSMYPCGEMVEPYYFYCGYCDCEEWYQE